MTIQCPEHKQNVVVVGYREQPLRVGFHQILRKIMQITTSKCPVFGCAYSVESDDMGVVIVDNSKQLQKGGN